MTAGSAVAPGHAAPPAPLWLALRKIPAAVRAGSTPAKLGLWLAALLAASLAGVEPTRTAPGILRSASHSGAGRAA